MLAFRAYGDEITTWVHKRLEVANEGMDGDALKEEAVPAYPVAYGNSIVRADYRNGNGDIYLYDIQSEQGRQITSDSAERALPDISGDWIVWVGYPNSSPLRNQ